ncbi:MAG TPA: methylenetetrahydrofolate reductase [NAD(P)H] [Candidatus Hydrogenedentes bacterium]|nr:methylenetetrahydrofolate reductase [NAD(P)H] [Candidatus Hydrogenedentota bacterium]
MRPLRALYASGKPVISFELFPPKTEAGMNNLFTHLEELANCRPAYFTCTYGAGGSTRNRTLLVLREIRERYPHIPVASHLSCIGSSRGELRQYIRAAIEIGVDRIVALRGDRPQDQEVFEPAPDGLRYANELVELIRREFPELGIIVAGYPETHPEAPSSAADLDNLKRKVDAGADVVITQLFFENTDYFRFRERCEDIGINVPIVPGILPVTNLTQIRRITSLCGTHLSPKLVRRLEVHGDDDEGQYAVGVYYAAKQAEELIAQGAPGIHFYVLNKSRAAALICRALALFTPVD